MNSARKSTALFAVRQRGAAVVEFAIVATVLTPLLIAMIMLTELSIAKLKYEEAARYAAWELTAFQLSDYKASNHDGLFSAALTQINSEVTQRYGDGDLDGATATGGASPTKLTPFQPFIVIRPQTDVAINMSISGGVNEDAKMLNFGAGGSIGSAVATVTGPLDDLTFKLYKFNEKALANIQITGTVNIAPGWNPRFWPGTGELSNKSDTIAGGSLPYTSTPVLLLADDWHLSAAPLPGAPVASPTDTSEVIQFSLPASTPYSNKPYLLQVERMAFGGFVKQGGILSSVSGVISNFAKYIQIDWPLDANRLVEIPYKLTPSSGQVKLTVDKGQVSFHTTEFRDQMTYTNSEYAKTLAKLGQGYMGCPLGQARTPTDGPNYPCNYP
jgi:Flp pilus assembly protein TadG